MYLHPWEIRLKHVKAEDMPDGKKDRGHVDIETDGVKSVADMYINKDEPNGSGEFHVDHDHETGKVRGVLCHSCNAGIGLLGDSVPILREAIRYLESFVSDQVPAVDHGSDI